MNRRSFLSGLGALVAAAGAGVKAAFPSISMRKITEYCPGSDVHVSGLDVLYGKMSVRPEWVELDVSRECAVQLARKYPGEALVEYEKYVEFRDQFLAEKFGNCCIGSADGTRRERLALPHLS